ncbi:hypothetical protein GCM10010376_74580 [Streptomyces violaceusniger]
MEQLCTGQRLGVLSLRGPLYPSEAVRRPPFTRAPVIRMPRVSLPSFHITVKAIACEMSAMEALAACMGTGL